MHAKGLFFFFNLARMSSCVLFNIVVHRSHQGFKMYAILPESFLLYLSLGNALEQGDITKKFILSSKLCQKSQNFAIGGSMKRKPLLIWWWKELQMLVNNRMIFRITRTSMEKFFVSSPFPQGQNCCYRNGKYIDDSHGKRNCDKKVEAALVRTHQLVVLESHVNGKKLDDCFD